MLVEEVRRRLAAAADPANAAAMQKYMKSSMPFRGLRAADVRRVCKQVYDAHPLPSVESWRSAVRELWDAAAYREERYAAIHLTGHRLYRAYQHPSALDLYRHLIVSGAWWDYVDQVASQRVGPILRAFSTEVTPVIRSWAVDDDLWLRRTAIICQLGSKDGTDLSLLTFALERNLEDSLHGSDFFIRKGIGWALRQYAYTDPEWVRGFVAEHEDRLSGLSKREALKHLG